MDPIQVDIRFQGPSAMVSVAGELDISTVPALRKSLQPLFDRDPPPVLLTFDLGRVSFMDSTGLAVFVDANRRGRLRGVEVHFCALQRQVRKLFDTTGVSNLFIIDDNLETNGHRARRRSHR